MVLGLLKKVFGTHNERELKRIQSYVDQVNALEPETEKLSDADLKAKTDEFRKRYQDGARLEELIPEAFAVVREAGRRTLNMRHFDVQLVGGVVLHEGKISEMKTGEGKTLVATLPVYLNALSGKGVHVVTVNEYLAKRDAEWMGTIYKFLGLSVGVIYSDMPEEDRQAAYQADVTYGTNNEFGFDYLRDNMKYNLSQYVQRELNFAIVDEVDSILIDEARTPLIISGPAEESTDKYYTINAIIPRLKKDQHYTVDEKARSAAMNDDGVALVENLLNIENLYAPENIDTLHHVNQGLRAHALFKNEVDYVVTEDGKVVIIDEFTGRMMTGRRYGDGLHQALEAKEGVTIENENQTLASITFQNYFRMYNKLAGMTGTADTEAEEFNSTYGLEVMVIPTHMPMIRNDYADLIYGTENEKYEAVIEEIKELYETGRPVLVGTISIERSEQLSVMLKKSKVPHNVLNAKHHAKEAEIIAQAGQKGAVTIATNMAGRGTDIKLEEGVQELGRLHILGSERHESRRIDNQLRGRSGRQGDPGSSRFYLSLQDDLMRVFGSDKYTGMMARLGLKDGQPIEHRMISKAVENAQRKVEAHNFDLRKHLLEYDDVMNKQREVVYSLRRDILDGTHQKELLIEFADEIIEDKLAEVCHEKIYPEEWDVENLDEYFTRILMTPVSKPDEKTIQVDGQPVLELEHCDTQQLNEALTKSVREFYERKEQELNPIFEALHQAGTFYGPSSLRDVEKGIMLETLDKLWRDHLLSMDHLKEGIGLRGYAQKNPLIEYKKEGFDLFSGMVFRMKEKILEVLFHTQIDERAVEALKFYQEQEKQHMVEHHGAESEDEQKSAPARNDESKVGRNDPCPCGSGKKYKKCHGR